MMNKASELLLTFLVIIAIGSSKAFAPIHKKGAVAQISPLAASSSSSFVGPVQESLEETLRNEFEPTYLSVINESHGSLQDESHFKVVIVSDAFEGQRLVQRHRTINSSVMNDNDGQLPFHALSITAKTNEEWDSNNNVPDSPACMGGH